MAFPGISRQALLALVVALVGAAVYALALPAPFLLDDLPAVVNNPGAHWPPDFATMWFKNYWGSPTNYQSLTIYRPLATLTFALTDWAGGADCPACHRLINMLLHGSISATVFWLAWTLLVPAGATALIDEVRARKSRLWGATVAGLLFAVHPVHTEAVVAIVSRCELLSALFVLLGTLALLRVRRHRMAVMAVLFALALLAKENGATLWSVVIAYHLVAALNERMGGRMRLERRDLWLHGALALVFAGYLVLRSQAVAGLLAGDLSASDNPIAGAGLVARVLTPGKVLLEYLRLLVAPVGLTIDYSLNHLPAATSLLDIRAWAGTGLAAAILVLIVVSVRRSFALAFVLLSFLGTYVVVSNTLFLSTIIMAERLIYLPSAFFIVAVVIVGCEAALAADRISRRGLVALVGLVLMLFAVGTVQRSRDWLTPLRLYTAAVAAAPQSAKSQHLLANELTGSGDPLAALPHFGAAVAIDPDNFVLRTNYARALAQVGRFPEALPHLEAALTLHPGYRPAFTLVCAIFERTGQPPAAGRYCFPAKTP